MGRKHCLRAISPFSKCFQKACFPGASKNVIVWEWVKIEEDHLLHLVGEIWNEKWKYPNNIAPMKIP